MYFLLHNLCHEDSSQNQQVYMDSTLHQSRKFEFASCYLLCKKLRSGLCQCYDYHGLVHQNAHEGSCLHSDQNSLPEKQPLSRFLVQGHQGHQHRPKPTIKWKESRKIVQNEHSRKRYFWGTFKTQLLLLVSHPDLPGFIRPHSSSFIQENNNPLDQLFGLHLLL